MTHLDWYLIHTKPARETTAADHLERQGFKTFLPRTRRQVRHAGRWRERIEAMFPRYLFVRLDTEEDDWAPSAPPSTSAASSASATALRSSRRI